MQTTVGNLLLDRALPEHLRGRYGTLDAKGLEKFLTEVAKNNPDDMSQVLRAIVDVSRDTVFRRGNEASIGLDDLVLPPDLQKYRERVRQEANDILMGPGGSRTKQQRLVSLLMKRIGEIPDELLAKLPEGNSLAAQVRSGARGNKSQLMQTLFGDVLVVDAQDRPVPIPALHGYGEGVTPMEYWAASNGARKGSVSVQFATADGGYFGKQMSNVGHRVIVTTHDCGTNRGMTVDPDDEDNIGAVLARDAGPYKAGTIITPDMMGKMGDKPITVRSLITCQQGDGVCAVCCGVREKDRLPDIGDPVGIVTARSISEPVTQAGLKCLDPETEVRMGDWSVKKLKDIKIGDMVMGIDLEGHASPVKVLNVFDNGIQPMWKYTWRVGASRTEFISIVCTAAHKLVQITNDEYRQFQSTTMRSPELLEASYAERDFSIVFPKDVVFKGGSHHEDNAWILGVMVGDGCYTPSVHTPHLSCDDPTLVPSIEEALAKMNMKLHFHKGSQCYWRVSNNVTYNGDHTPNRMIDLLRKYSMYEKYSFEKDLPEGWETWDRESLLAFVCGIIDTDGHIGIHEGRAMLTLGQTSESLLRGILKAISKCFGIPEPHVVINPGKRKHALYTARYVNPADLYKLLTGMTLHGARNADKERILEALEEQYSMRTLEGRTTGKFLSCEPVGDKQALDIEVDNKDHLFLLANYVSCANSKHTGGVAGTDDKQVSGFKEMNQFVQVPENFLGAATLTDVDGVVSSVKEAPAGGWNVKVGESEFYVPAEREVIVKRGDQVYAGDMLSDGTPNPAELTALKGVGEGRRYFVEMYRKMLKKNGASNHRRNIEALARGFVNRIEINDPDGYDGYIMGDVVPYDSFAKDYQPRPGSQALPIDRINGTYLEQPVLHYTIGTRVTPRVMEDFRKAGLTEPVMVNSKPPVFDAKVIRARSMLSSDPDWITRMAGENLKKNFLEGARMGATSTPASTSYFPGMANPAELDKYLGGSSGRGNGQFVGVK